MVAAKKMLATVTPIRPLHRVPDPPRHRVGPRADLMDAYLEMLARIPLFSPAEERQAAKTLRELELEAWRRALPYRGTLEFVGQHARILELQDRAALEAVAAHAGPIPLAPAAAHPLA